MQKRGWVPVALKVSKPCEEYPKGGTYQRLEKLLLSKRESWDEVITRLLDYWEAGHLNGK